MPLNPPAYGPVPGFVIAVLKIYSLETAISSFLWPSKILEQLFYDSEK